MSERRSTRSRIDSPTRPSLLRQRPTDFMVYLILAGVAALFVGLTFAYLFSRSMGDWEAFSLPRIFWLSTALLGLSSWTLHRALKAYAQDDREGLLRHLGLTFLLGLAFLLAQVSGWQQMLLDGQSMAGNVAATYLYVMSGLHVAHVMVGLLVLGISLYRARRHTHEPVTRLLFFADPVRAAGLRMVALYWHAVNVLWLYLFLFFLFFHS